MPQNPWRKLQEGNSYRFRVSKKVNIPPDNDEYIVVVLDDIRLLLKKNHFPNTEFIPNKEINCRVDKIGCNGKIYLEPENTNYKLFEDYFFDFEKIIEKDGNKRLLLYDDNGNKIDLIYDEDFYKIDDDKVLCKLWRIKKSKLYVSYTGFFSEKNNYKLGNLLKMKIDGVVNLIYDEKYYRLIDENGLVNYIRAKYYEDYGFKTGDYIYCNVVEKPALYYNYLEPAHPHYKIGQVYEFDLLRIENEYDTIDKYQIFVRLIDDKGTEYHANCYETPQVRTGKYRKVKALVENIKMSRLFLKCLDCY